MARGGGRAPPAGKTRRVTFSEITKPAIQAAFAHPRAIDVNLVDAQQARRVVDRLVGYTLSPLLWRKVRAGLSAGRVQSVAVRLVVEREREIHAFGAVEYWTIEILLRTGDGETFVADLVRVDGAKPAIGDEATALAIAGELRAARPRVVSVTRRESSRNPAPPFTTSTLQQEASRKLGFAPKRTMSAAQRLYEGIAVGGEQTGLITYMRTDSVALSAQAIAEAHDVIVDRYGAPYAVPKGRHYKTKSRNAQEAHEAVRPTSFARDPDSIAIVLKSDEARLYRLIWQRAIASQMAAKRLETSAIELEAGRLGLRASATRTLFDGFSRVYTEGRDDGQEEREATLPDVHEGEQVDVARTETGEADVRPTQHFTEPPPRYTEATLVKALEENGIGRPSTYAATLSTIVDRGYVAVREKRLVPEAIGFIVTDLLVAHFGEFVDVDFTARMEGDLDSVASGERRWVPVVRDFYTPLAALVAEKLADVRPADVGVKPEDMGLPADLVCSEGHPMLVRAGRYGEFLACSHYPDHKESRPLPPVAGSGTDGADAKPLGGVGDPCPECGETDGGVLMARNGRFGPFVGCARYPECTYIRKEGPPPPEQLGFEAACPTCAKGHLVARRARRDGTVFWGCSRYPKCTYTSWREPLGPVHDPDGAPLARTDDPLAGVCLGCGATVPLPAELPAPGSRLAGGTPDAAALARPRAARGEAASRRPARARTGGTARRRTGAASEGASGTAGRPTRGKSRAAAVPDAPSEAAPVRRRAVPPVRARAGRRDAASPRAARGRARAAASGVPPARREPGAGSSAGSGTVAPQPRHTRQGVVSARERRAVGVVDGPQRLAPAGVRALRVAGAAPKRVPVTACAPGDEVSLGASGTPPSKPSCCGSSSPSLRMYVHSGWPSTRTGARSGPLLAIRTAIAVSPHSGTDRRRHRAASRPRVPDPATGGRRAALPCGPGSASARGMATRPAGRASGGPRSRPRSAGSPMSSGFTPSVRGRASASFSATSARAAWRWTGTRSPLATESRSPSMRAVKSTSTNSPKWATSRSAAMNPIASGTRRFSRTATVARRSSRACARTWRAAEVRSPPAPAPPCTEGAVP